MLSPVDTTHSCQPTCIISKQHAKQASYTIIRGQKLCCHSVTKTPRDVQLTCEKQTKNSMEY